MKKEDFHMWLQNHRLIIGYAGSLAEACSPIPGPGYGQGYELNPKAQSMGAVYSKANNIK